MYNNTTNPNSVNVIKQKRISLQKQIKLLQIDIEELQEICTHSPHEHIDRASTGHYDPGCNEYWTDHYCPYCDKRWRTDQNWNKK